MKTISELTLLIPDIIADAVVREGHHIHPQQDFTEATEHLVARAERHFANAPTFHHKLKAKGNKGRDCLYSFMRHWLAGWMVEHGTPLDTIPARWSNGGNL